MRAASVTVTGVDIDAIWNGLVQDLLSSEDGSLTSGGEQIILGRRDALLAARLLYLGYSEAVA